MLQLALAQILFDLYILLKANANLAGPHGSKCFLDASIYYLQRSACLQDVNGGQQAWSQHLLAQSSDSCLGPPAGSRAAAYAFLYPNIMLNRYGPWLDINIVEPTGTQSCQVRFEYYLEQSASLDAAVVEASLASSHEVQLEDVKLCESVQRGLGSPAYDTGRSVAQMENS